MHILAANVLAIMKFAVTKNCTSHTPLVGIAAASEFSKYLDQVPSQFLCFLLQVQRDRELSHQQVGAESVELQLHHGDSKLGHLYLQDQLPVIEIV